MSSKLKKKYILLSVIIVVIAVIIILILRINKNIKIDDNYKYEFKNEYKNNEHYLEKASKNNYRNIEYVGGIDLYLDRSVPLSLDEPNYIGERWYPFYRDKDTGEILRGNEKQNYITAGMPYIGLDHMDVPEERMTKIGFKDYVLNWTGSVLYRKLGFIDKNDFENGEFVDYKSFFGEYNGIGRYECGKYPGRFYDMPIDIVANYLWNYNYKDYLENKDIEKIDNINDALKYDYKTSDTRFSENQWVFNILRNCFGFVSDDFYAVQEENKLNFNECDIENVEIGDIGVYDSNGYAIGICIGFDNKHNPVFSVCTSKEINNKMLEIDDYVIKNILNKKMKTDIYGYNILHIEDKKDINKQAFIKYYKTFLPFTDTNEIGTSKNKSLIIKDIVQYNNQIKLLDDIDNNDLYIKLINERKRRLVRRENLAKSVCDINKIDLSHYKTIDISTIFIINELRTYEFEKFRLKTLYNRDIDRNEKERLKRKTYIDTVKAKREDLADYGNDFTEEQIEKIYKDNKENIKKYIIENYDTLKEKDEQGLRDWFFQNGGMTEFEFKMLKRYISEYPEMLE